MCIDLGGCQRCLLTQNCFILNAFLTHKCSQQPKTTWQFWWNPSGESIVWKIIEGEKSIRTLQTTFLWIFCEIILNSKVIVKSILDPGNNIYKNSLPLCCGWLMWPQQNDANELKNDWSLAHGYSSEGTLWGLSDEYQYDRVKMIFIKVCLLVHWAKVAPTSEGLRVLNHWQPGSQLISFTYTFIVTPGKLLISLDT